MELLLPFYIILRKAITEYTAINIGEDNSCDRSSSEMLGRLYSIDI